MVRPSPAFWLAVSTALALSVALVLTTTKGASSPLSPTTSTTEKTPLSSLPSSSHGAGEDASVAKTATFLLGIEETVEQVKTLNELFKAADSSTPLASLLEAAATRKEAIALLAKRSPRLVLSLYLDDDVRAKLPSEVQANVETSMSGIAEVAEYGMYMTREALATLDKSSLCYFAITDTLTGETLVPIFTSSRHSARTLSSGVIFTYWGVRLAGTDKVIVGESPIQVLSSGEEGRRTCGRVGGEVKCFESPEALEAAAEALYEAEVVRGGRGAAAKAARLTSRSLTRDEVTVLVVIVLASDETVPLTTPASYSVLTETVKTYWSAVSTGCSTLNFKFAPTVVLPNPRSYYAPTDEDCPIITSNSEFDNDAVDTLAGLGVSVDDYDRYILLFNNYVGCPWLGLGSVVGASVWVNGYANPILDWHVTAHELGHNFGLKHANLWVPSNPEEPFMQGESVPYYDDYDVMGAVTIDADRMSFHSNSFKKSNMDWIKQRDIYIVDDQECFSAPCVVQMFAHDNIEAQGTRAMRYQVGASGTLRNYFWIEHRAHLVHSTAGSAFANGLAFYYISDNGVDTQVEVESDLIDMNPPLANATEDALLNAPLMVGQTFVSPVGAAVVTPMYVAQDANGLNFIVVNMYTGPRSGINIDVGSISTDCPESTVGETVYFWTTEVDLPNGAFYSWNFGDTEISRRNSIVTSHAYQVAGEFVVTLTVSDGRGSSSSTTTTVVVGDDVLCSRSRFYLHGTCTTSGYCVCDDGWTGDECATEIVIEALVPAHDTDTEPTVVVNVRFTDGVIESSDAVVYCRFTGLAITRGTRLSPSEVDCPTEGIVVDDVTRVELEVSFDAGVTWTSSHKVFTFAGGACSVTCVGGTCDAARGLCVCDVGFTGDDCNTPVVISNIEPSTAPDVGNMFMVLDVSSLPASPSGSCRDLVVRFTTEADAATYDVRGTFVSPSSVYVYSPAVVSVGSATVQLSPNRGVDWSAPLEDSLEFVTTDPLFDGWPRTGLEAPGAFGLKYFSVFHGDSNVDLNLVISGDKDIVVYLSTLRSPSRLVCDDPDYADFAPLYTCWGNLASSTLDATFSAADAEVSVGTYVIAVGAADGTACTFDIEFGTPPGSIVHLTSNAVGAQSGYATDSARTFTFAHEDDGFATMVVVEAAFEGDELEVVLTSAGDEPETVTLATSALAVSDSYILQYCAPVGTGTLVVTGIDAPYTIRAYKLVTPGAGQPIIGTRELNQVSLQWFPTTYTGGSADDLAYYLFWRPAVADNSFNSTCGLRGATSLSGDDPLAFGEYTAKVGNLEPATAYDFNVRVVAPNGVEAVYSMLLQRTLPEPVPLALFYYIAGAALVLMAITGIALVCLHRRREKKISRRHKYRSDLVEGTILRSFKAGHKNELSVDKGDKILVVGLPNKQNWQLAIDPDTRRKGLVPYSYIKMDKAAATAAAASYKSRSSKSKGKKTKKPKKKTIQRRAPTEVTKKKARKQRPKTSNKGKKGKGRRK